MKIKVLLAEDHTVVREGLRRLLETAPDIEIVGEAERMVKTPCTSPASAIPT